MKINNDDLARSVETTASPSDVHAPTVREGFTHTPGLLAHTPGPWRAGYWSGICRIPAHVEVRRHPGPPDCHYDQIFSPMCEDGSCAGIVGSEPGVDVVSTDYDSLRIRVPDAVLIAAAPELLSALKMLLADIEDYQRINHLGGEQNHAQVMARAAIAKAEGR